MLLVQFTCIAPKHSISTSKQAAYVNNIFSSLCNDGYIDAVVVDCPSGTKIEKDVVQELSQGI